MHARLCAKTFVCFMNQDLEEEQLLVARLLHNLCSDSPDEHFKILLAARARLENGGPARLRHTFPALAFCALRIVRKLSQLSSSEQSTLAAEPVLQWLLEVSLQLAEVPAPMQALRLLLCCAHVTSEEAGLEMLAYEFFEQVRRRQVSGMS